MKINSISEQKIEDCILIVKQLLADNNLDNWDIKINRRRLTLARTFHHTKTLYFSKFFLVITNEEQLRSIALHEIAHALAGPGNAHGDKFVKLYQSICKESIHKYPVSDIVISKYITKCPVCNNIGTANNKKPVYCSKCLEKGEIAKLEIKERDTKVVPL